MKHHHMTKYGLRFSNKDTINIDKSQYGKNLLGLALMEIREKLK